MGPLGRVQDVGLKGWVNMKIHGIGQSISAQLKRVRSTLLWRVKTIEMNTYFLYFFSQAANHARSTRTNRKALSCTTLFRGTLNP